MDAKLTQTFGEPEEADRPPGLPASSDCCISAVLQLGGITQRLAVPVTQIDDLAAFGDFPLPQAAPPHVRVELNQRLPERGEIQFRPPPGLLPALAVGGFELGHAFAFGWRGEVVEEFARELQAGLVLLRQGDAGDAGQERAGQRGRHPHRVQQARKVGGVAAA